MQYGWKLYQAFTIRWQLELACAPVAAAPIQVLVLRPGSGSAGRTSCGVPAFGRRFPGHKIDHVARILKAKEEPAETP